MTHLYRRLFLCVACLFYLTTNSFAIDIFHNGVNLITGTWTGNGTLVETPDDFPLDGSTHFRFTYDYDGFWAGFGLNLDNWGSSSPYDFSGYTHIYFAYRGLNNNQTFRLQLRSGDTEGPSFDIGGNNSDYQIIKIPLVFLAGSLDLTQITELIYSIGGDFPEGNGTVYLDAIYLADEDIPAIGSASWGLQQALGKGFNLTNWLEAYWLIPFNAYPEVDRYDRTHVEFLADAGMDHIRLPVTFEHLTGPGPDYLLDLDHIVFDLIDSAIQWAEDYDLLLIIDNHHGTVTLSNDNYENELPRLKAVWSQIIDLYGHLDPNTCLFEIYNEPTSAISNNNLRVFFEELVSEIRMQTQDHTLIIGGNGYNSGNGLTSFLPLENDQRIIYTFHSYDPYFFTHQGMSWTDPPFLPPRAFPEGDDENVIRNIFTAVSEWSGIYDLPVYLGEYGCAVSADEDSRCNYINHLMHLSDSLSFSHAYWDVFYDFGFANPDQLDGSQVDNCFAQAIGLNFIVLSMAIIDFDQGCHLGYTDVTWQMAPGEDLLYYQLEYSRDAVTWTSLPEMEQVNNYGQLTFSIPAHLGPYIRLQQHSTDGDTYKSPIRKINCPQDDMVKIYPNPAVNHVTIKFEKGYNHSPYNITLYDPLGRQLPTSSDNTSNGDLVIDIGHLPQGAYQLILDSNTERIQQTLLIQK